ncbi:MAG: amidohydrolase family protein, partial [Clostridia bacterium]|nr:amidohydrolase family protein [Clostridia bacterium]
MKTTLIKNGIIITVDAADTVWQKGWIRIEDQRIAAMGEGEAPEAQPDWQVIDARNKAVLPGIVDVHTHVCGSLFKGMTEDAHNGFYGLALPMERLLTPENTYTLSLLGAAECLLAGVTCICDIYHYMRDTARAVRDLGLRGVLAHKIIETDLAGIQHGDYTRIPAKGRARVEENVRLIEEYHGKG